MTRNSFYNTILTVAGILVLGVSGLAQGKHGGKDKGGDQGERGGGQEKHQQRGDDDRGGDRGDRGDRGNGNGWGRHKHEDHDQERAYRQNGQEQWQQQRQNERVARQQNEWAYRQQQDQQRQNERAVRGQQEQYYRQQRDQQRQDERSAREQQRGQYYPQPEYRQAERKDNGRHLGWYKNGKAYTSDNLPWAASRDWRSNDDYRRDDRYTQRNNAYTYNNYSDPIVNYLPTYQNYRPSGSARENIIRSLISGFFGGRQQAYQPAYQNYQPYQSYQTYSPNYGGYQHPYYQRTSYSPSYGVNSPYYGGSQYGYDPYAYDPFGYQQPYAGSQMFGGGGLKSTLLNVGLSLLQGFLGNGYEQGLNQGEYARDRYSRPVNTYYDPYAAAEPAYYSPLASSFADQRQLLQEGYRLGYRDAMQQQDPYGSVIENNAPVNLVSQFLANTIINRI